MKIVVELWQFQSQAPLKLFGHWKLRFRSIAMAEAATLVILFVWARYPSGKGEVCKTFIRGFDSHPRLQISASVFPRISRES